MMAFSEKKINGIRILTLENDLCSVSVVPALGGKILSVYNKKLQKEFVWTNKNLSLQIHPAGADYDSNFIGGIDELLPNDIPETIDSIDFPDHGELWTTALDYETGPASITVMGKLKRCGLYYQKKMKLDDAAPFVHLDYRMVNETQSVRSFLWKLHAPVNIQPGDRLLSRARHGKVVDPAYSRFTDNSEFAWPLIQGTDASIAPPNNNSIDFFYLYDTVAPRMLASLDEDKHLFGYLYDQRVFPYQWYFASYGGFLGHYTAILEPCTSMPISVNEAKESHQCSVLQPGASLSTTVSIFAGESTQFKLWHE